MGIRLVSLLLFLHCFSPTLAIITDFTTDRSALVEFKAHITIGPRSILASNWTTSVSVCKWIGVSCSGGRHGRRVTALDLTDMDLKGTVPPHLGNLSSLLSLNLSNNNFHGQLPKELARLSRLESINLMYNRLSGEIPDWFGNLSRLHYMLLRSNNFTGTIPITLSNISTLEVLDLNFNLIQGNIPYQIAELHNLEQLRIRQNHLSGRIPSQLYNISSLRLIDLALNNLSGNLPDSICDFLPNLERLILGANGLDGRVPSSLGKCRKLRNLTLSINGFTGPIPRSIGNLTELGELLMSKNSLQGEIPDEIGKLRNLWYMNLGHNKLSGSIPSTLFNISTVMGISVNDNYLSGHLPPTIGNELPSLEELRLWGNNLEGIIPDSISNASKLRVIDLGPNDFSGLIPNTLGNLRLLEVLILHDCNLITHDWTFLSSLTNCRHLRDLEIGNNPVYGVLPSSIGNLSSNLEYFMAYNCKIRGHIPLEIGNLSNLVEFDFNGNELTGLIPATIGRLENLQGLRLHQNMLEGTIPSDMCHLRRLNTLFLSSNNLSGSIPSCLPSLTSLRHLYLDSNSFSSVIPSTFNAFILDVNLSSNFLTGFLPLGIGNSKVMTTFDLSRNQLSGNLSGSIGSMKDLTYLSLANNHFQGPIPQSFGDLISLAFLDLSTNVFSGKIPKSLEALKNLKYLNLSFNNLSGEIPSGGPFRNFSIQSYMRNYALCGSPQLQVPPCHDSGAHPSKVPLLLKYILPAIGSTILAITVILFFVKRRRGKQNLNVTDQESNSLPVATFLRISRLELERATEEFSESNLLGSGAFGSVYKGSLPDGSTVAIKVFKSQLDESSRSFEAECEILGSTRHRNLVKIISACYSVNFKALILEFMPNGNLEKWLYSHNYCLDFLQRLNIMIDVASALEYLHHGYSTPIVHCDLKPSNVLLDEEMVAHVADFGVAKLLGQGKSMTQTMTLATFGYMAPEYGSLGIVSTKGDIYSFGILLLETFTRRKPVDDMFGGEVSLKSWVRDSLSEALDKVVDANLQTEDEKNITGTKMNCISSIFELALDCSADSPEVRGNMKDILAMLQNIRNKFLKVYTRKL